MSLHAEMWMRVRRVSAASDKSLFTKPKRKWSPKEASFSTRRGSARLRLKGVFNYIDEARLFVESTGFTNQTNDGTVIILPTDRVERSANTKSSYNGDITACEKTFRMELTAAKRLSNRTIK
jgi:hypothetical protein